MDGIPSASSSSPSRSSNSRFKTLPILHPHEVELRVNVKELSRPIAPEKFRSKTQSVGGFVFGLLVFPQGTKSAPEHARKNRGDEDDKNSKKGEDSSKKQRWISAFVEARPSEDYPASWCFSDVQFLVSLINYEEVARSIVKHDKHTFSPTESSDGKAIDRGWHDFVSCDEQTLRESGFVDADDHVCFRASVYLAGGPMKVTTSKTKRYLELQKIDGPLYCNSMVQTMFHLGLLRNLIYGESNTNVGRLSYGTPKSETVNWKKYGTESLDSLRDVCFKLQLRTSQVVSCKEFPQIEGSLDAWFTTFYHHLLSAMLPENENSTTKRKSKKEQMNRAEQLRDLLEFDIHWSGRDHKGKMMEVTYRGPLFSLLIRGFSDLETCLGHYFAKKRVLNSGDGTCTARRTIRSLPPIVMWHLKRGEYDPEGIPDTYFEFPRRIDMARYMERRDDADLHYVLYAVIVEVEPSVGHERRYYAFLRPEMEGDKGQWYRFDDGPVNSVHAVSNATAMDASLGGEEWLCVNYLYGPGSVLTRPKSSRACLLCYIREVEAAQLLKEPRLPKKKNSNSDGMRARSPVSAADEIANMRAESLIEELEQQELREQKKKQQKQKKKQKEKEKRKTIDKDSLGSQMGQTAGESLSAHETGESEPDRERGAGNEVSLKKNKLDSAHPSSNLAVPCNEGKKRKPHVTSTPSAGSSSPALSDGVERKNGPVNASAQSKRKEDPATPSTGSAPAEGKSKPPSDSKDKQREEKQRATVAVSGATSSGPQPARTKKERKKKAAEADALKNHPSTPAVGSTAATAGSSKEDNATRRDTEEKKKGSIDAVKTHTFAPDPRTSDVAKSPPVPKQAKAPPETVTKDVRAKTSPGQVQDARASSTSLSPGTDRPDGEKASPPRAFSVINPPKAKLHGVLPNAVLPPKKVGDRKDTSEGNHTGPSAKAAPNISMPKPPTPKATAAAQALAQPKAPVRAKSSSGPNVQAKAPLSNAQGKAPAAQPGTPGAKARTLQEVQAKSPQQASASTVANAGNGCTTHAPPQTSPHPSCSSSSPGGWYPQQLLVDDPSARIQFECTVCHRIVRKPVVLECAHLFCRGCLTDYGNCPTCLIGYGELACLEQTRGGALALLHRVYSGLKLRCLYHPDMRDQPWDELKKTTMTCEWRGFLQDYAKHLDTCAAHQATLNVPMSELGEMELSSDWNSDLANPPIDVKAGSVFHISSFDESKQWAYAFVGSASGALVGWLPRNRLQRKVYQVTYPYCSNAGAGETDCPNSEIISMEVGQGVVVYHRQGNGWVYGAVSAGDSENVGWFPERCIA